LEGYRRKLRTTRWGNIELKLDIASHFDQEIL
jgi:hypothetical protein